jgi:hypothetical protein
MVGDTQERARVRNGDEDEKVVRTDVRTCIMACGEAVPRSVMGLGKDAEERCRLAVCVGGQRACRR